MALITAAEARDLLPQIEGTGSDTLLALLVTGVDGAFARWCGYPPVTVGTSPTLEDASYTRYLTGQGGRWLTLDVWPALSLTSIEDDPTLTWDGSTYLVASAGYILMDGRRVLLKETSAHGLWSKSEGAIKVVFTAGFSTIPEDLKTLAKLGVKNAFELRNHAGKQSQSQGDTSTTWRDEDYLPPHVRRGLSAFKLPRAIL